MKRISLCIPLAASVLLAGCLEVEQYPAWRNGEYNNKPDALPSQAYFHGDQLGWNAVLTDRTHLQDEYRRTKP
jgi:hypothetical protein